MTLSKPWGISDLKRTVIILADFIYPTVKRITSHYGYRTHPITGAKTSKHHGTDFAQPGTHNIKAAAAGTVTRSYRSTSYGECVFILHNIRGQQFESVYAHMRAGSRRVSVGQKVKQGQIIGIMGSTGNSTGQHLHFELHKGRWNINKTNGVNPLKYLPSLSDPEVKKLQKNLKKLGYKPGAIDGLEGDNTTKAVKAFQRAEGLTVDGKAGAKTKAKINHILNGGLTLSEYKKVMKEINSLKKQLKKKENKPSKGKVSSVHEANWDWGHNKRITNQSNPHAKVSYEQAISLLKNLHDVIKPTRQEAGSSHGKAWEKAVKNGVFDGSNPHHPLTREQAATVLNTLGLLDKDELDEEESVAESE